MAALALTPPLLPFQRRALDELVAGDGLAVFSAGLGWHGVVAALLHLQARRRWGGAGGVGGVGHGREVIYHPMTRYRYVYFIKNNLIPHHFYLPTYLPTDPSNSSS